MVMDEAVAKPETYGLAPGWSGALMGMMTLVRVAVRQVRRSYDQGERGTAGEDAAITTAS